MRRLDAAVFLSGAALMGLEIVGSRVLAPVFGTSIFVWGALITTFLASLAIGYATGGRLADRRPQPGLLAALIAASACLLWVLFFQPAPILALCAAAPVPDRFRSLLAALVLFAPPSVLMGAVTPFAVRLSARDLRSIGSEAGRLSAISTAGSILGTFAMSFLLIPAFPTRPIVYGLGLSLVVAAALVPGVLTGRRLALGALVTAGTAVAYLGTPSFSRIPIQSGTVIFEKETAYHHLRVVDVGTRRALYFNALQQGFVEMDPAAKPRASYLDGLHLGWIFREKPPRSVVIIGLGAGVLSTQLARRSAETATTAIEIDPEVVRTAERFFRYAPDANDRVIVGDGRRELALNVPAGSADGILSDAYFADSAPFHLLTKEFYELALSKLSPDGVFVANFVGTLTGPDNALFWASFKSLAEVFPRVYIFNDELAAGRPTFRSNAMLVATRSPDRIDRATIVERAGRVAEWLGRPAVKTWAETLYDGQLHVEKLPLLTDAYSPTDALQHLGR